MTAAELSRQTILVVGLIALAGQAGGWLARRVGQPKVIGEIVAGIALGPSILGAVWSGAETGLFRPEVVSALKPLADIGLVLFMFVVGMELDHAHLRGQRHRAVVISHASIILPFAGGAGLAWAIHGTVAPGTRLLPFCLFLGAAMAVTAFPVLARILQETGLDRRPVGAMTLACAAIDDVTAWCILAAVLAIGGGDGPASVATTVAASLAFTAAMWWVVRPLLARVGHLNVAVAVALAFGAAWATDLIGIHAIFGAFIAGAIMPRERTPRLVLVDQIEGLTNAVLLPVFFMTVGLSTRLGLVDSVELWAIAAAVTVVAMAGKLIGAGLAARATGETWRDAGTIAVLMNTRGLTEIVILTVGLERGIISPTVFTIMVIMALVTTVMAAPVLRWAGVAEVRSGGRARRGTPTIDVAP